jgi:hypothetical protein
VARTLGYAALALALVLFGIAGLLSIGAPFLLTGLAMLVCFPWRRRRDILWPAIAGVWGFAGGYIFVAPRGCTGTSYPRLVDATMSTAPTTTCNGVFFDYSGGASYNPPLLPAVLVGAAVAIALALGVRALLSKGAGGAAFDRHDQLS